MNEINIDLLEIVDEIPTNLKCVSCDKLLNDPHCAPCGCEYCYKCILLIINESEDKYCIGDKDYCHDEILEIDKNIFKNHATNFKILNLKVKCPNDCNNEYKYKYLGDHLKTCKGMLKDCIYNSIGCCSTRLTNSTLLNHLDEMSLEHGQMVMKSLQNLKEVCEAGNQKHNNLYEEVKNDFKRLSKSFEDLTKKFEEIMKKLELDIANQKKQKDVPSQIELTDIIKEQINLYFQNSNISSNDLNELKNVRMLLLNIEPFSNSTYDWLILNFEEKYNGSIDNNGMFIESDEFYLKGYKLKLFLFSSNYDVFGCDLMVRFSFIIGQFDDILDWPFKWNLKFDLLNYSDESALWSSIASMKNDACCEWKQPKLNESKVQSKLYRIIPFNTLFSQKVSLLKNGDLRIRCSIFI